MLLVLSGALVLIWGVCGLVLWRRGSRSAHDGATSHRAVQESTTSGGGAKTRWRPAAKWAAGAVIAVGSVSLAFWVLVGGLAGTNSSTRESSETVLAEVEVLVPVEEVAAGSRPDGSAWVEIKSDGELTAEDLQAPTAYVSAPVSFEWQVASLVGPDPLRDDMRCVISMWSPPTTQPSDVVQISVYCGIMGAMERGE